MSMSWLRKGGVNGGVDVLLPGLVPLDVCSISRWSSGGHWGTTLCSIERVVIIYSVSFLLLLLLLSSSSSFLLLSFCRKSGALCGVSLFLCKASLVLNLLHTDALHQSLRVVALGKYIAVRVAVV